MIPVWTGDRVYRESILPLRQDSGKEEIIPLLYKASRIIEVRSATLQSLYEEGKDYSLLEGKLRIPSGSAIPIMPVEDYYPDHVEKDKSFWRKSGGYIAFTPWEYFHNCQAVVTYEHKSSWDGPVPYGKLNLLPKLAERLRSGKAVKVLFYGDSITCGYNSSGKVNAQPYLPDWTQLVMRFLKTRWPDVPFSDVNTAVGGKSSDWAVKEAQVRAADHMPNLAIIAFGMNDGTGRVPAANFKANILAVMDTVTAAKPECEFLLVATSLANPEVLLFNERQREPWEDPCMMDHRSFAGNQTDYLPVLESIEREGAVVADMTSLHTHILKTKRFHDMSGNNVNHPNDFFARVYAQLVATTLSI
jgi:lysophospholipase L1-like esterase